MKKLFTLITALLFFGCNVIVAQTSKPDTRSEVEYYKVSEVRIYIHHQSDILELRKQGFGFDNLKLNDNSFDVMLDGYQLNILKKTGYRYKILIDDVTKDYLERTKESRAILKTKKGTITSGFGLGSMGGFYTFDEVVAQLDSMRNKYPNLITAKDSIGTSLEGRTIWAVKISDNPDIKETEPEIFYNSLIHAREPQSMMCVLYFMFYLLENYGTDSIATYLVNNRELYFVPVINPDGYVYNEEISPEGGGMWRKNTRVINDSIFGVDLNRNFGYLWGYDDFWSSPDPKHMWYRGTGPFSEPETQVVRQFCLNHNFIISNNYHSFGNYICSPWGYNLNQSSDSLFFNNLIKFATFHNGYHNAFDLSLPENYPTNGGVCDWMYGETSEKNRIFAFLTEVGSSSEGFWPKPERIIPLAKENLYSNMIFALGPGIIENPPNINKAEVKASYINRESENLNINAIEHNPDNLASQVYAQILNSKDSLVNETLLTQTDSIFNGSLNIDSFDEDFYEVQFRQSGIDIPINLYYSDPLKLKFTTAGPVVVDSISFRKGTSSYGVKLYLKNKSEITTIKNPSVKISCNDPWVLPISQDSKNTQTILPGKSETHGGTFMVKYIDSLFTGYFNFKFEISSNDYHYWTDSLQLNVNVTAVHPELQETTTMLEQNFPNPFNPETIIPWQIPENTKVTLKILDMVGRTVEILVDEQRPQGQYETKFNAATLPKGIYFYQLKAGENVQTRKMILLE